MERTRAKLRVLFVHARCLYVCVYIHRSCHWKLVRMLQSFREPVSFYSRRMGNIYTCSQGHSPHIYYTRLSGATGSEDATLYNTRPAADCWVTAETYFNLKEKETLKALILQRVLCKHASLQHHFLAQLWPVFTYNKRYWHLIFLVPAQNKVGYKIWPCCWE